MNTRTVWRRHIIDYDDDGDDDDEDDMLMLLLMMMTMVIIICSSSSSSSSSSSMTMIDDVSLQNPFSSPGSFRFVSPWSIVLLMY